MNNHTDIPPHKCSKCGYLMDCTSEAYGDHKPNPGDISMCLSCGHLTRFDQDLKMQELTPGEAREIGMSPEVLQAQLTRSAVVGDNIKRRRKVRVK